ncbi:MAG TPA: AAA domain-containing protein [Firmicutes bacterium]|nr:AAA domain-containing protein [Bacillota bacterium]
MKGEEQRLQEAGFSVKTFTAAFFQSIRNVVVLPDENILEKMLAALICGGHILLHDVPGVGKTLLARTFSRALGLSFSRIQFTPDLLPTDVTGINYFNQKTREFEFRPGPVFTNILLADEINRATPRTQSSLLECMQEATVTVDGETRKIGFPFLVLATENPLEMEGTFPLPEAQLDRFFMCLNLGYPGFEGEKAIVRRFLNDDPLEEVEAVATVEDLLTLKKLAAEVRFSEPVLNYMLTIARETRNMDGVRLGVSPRGTLYYARAAQALALLRGRNYVIPDDLQELAVPVLAHRLLLEMSASLQDVSRAELIKKVVSSVDVPLDTEYGMKADES